MNSRERMRSALNHQSTDRVPIDLGGTPVSGIAASTYARLRTGLGLPRQPVKVYEPYQILGLVEQEVRALLGIDTIPILGLRTNFGFKNERWKPWRLFDGTEVLVPGDFVTSTDAKGDRYIYPQGDRSAPPSGRMPHDGYYFDALIRQEAIDEEQLDPEAWLEGYIGKYTDEELAYLQAQADDHYANTDLSLVYWFGQGGLGDIGAVPATWVKHPKGIRDIAEWYMAFLQYPEYIKGIFDLQTNIAMENLPLLYQAVGDKIDVVVISATDFGTQTGPFFAPEMYREFMKSHHTRLNAWIHSHTPWKTFIHTCGAVTELLDDFVQAGFDVLNPVQCSAAGMDPVTLKANWGEKLVFWGGTVDTQRVLPFGTPDEVRAQTAERIRVLGKGGGLVAGAIHNVQHGTPINNLLAFFETARNSASCQG